MKVKLLAITPDSERLIEQAGRICYDSEMNAETRGQFIRKRINQGHESILEHATASFLIEGVSRALTHQLCRHRLLSISQQSQRYCKLDFNDCIEAVMPPEILKDESKKNGFNYMLDEIKNLYDYFIENGVKAEDARFLLPNAAKTKLIVTANFREWRHIIKIRTEKHAQWEIRELMKEIKIILQEACPNCFEDL